MNKHLSALLAMVCTGLAAGVQTQSSTPTNASRAEISAALKIEAELVAVARAAAKDDNDSKVSEKLEAPSSVSVFGCPSAVLAVRTAAVCAGLQADGEEKRAEKLAHKVLAQLKKMSEPTDADRLARLYWEAWLHAEVLDDSKSALKLLDAAAKLSPDDGRVLDGQKRWTDSGKAKK